MVEQVLMDQAIADDRWRVALLRYFNPVGAHESGLIGDDPNGIPNNLLPYISQVAVGKLAELAVFGNDYSTPDGTCVRDYVHVMDLAAGHLCALKALQTRRGTHVWNLGTGKGYSVIQMVQAFAQASDCTIPYHIAPRRPGDIATCYADPTRAEHELGWKAQRSLAEMMLDVWRWQSRNPDGYKALKCDL
jgi:UDP-glucose 4-epimerase